jgi:death-on-curing protein
MKEPQWLGLESVLALHELVVADYGGDASIRDAGRLQSALARPKHLFSYGEPTLARLAAAYAVGIVQGHPFTDGNKRTGFMAAAAFLELNGLKFEASEVEVVIKTLGLAASEVSEAEYGQWLAKSVEAPKEKKGKKKAKKK